MRTADGPLTDVLIAAFRYFSPEELTNAGVLQPYDWPEALRPHSDRVLAEVTVHVTSANAGNDVATPRRAGEWTLSDAAEWLFRGDGVYFPEAACVLLASGALSIQDAHDIADAVPQHDLVDLRRQVVLNCLAGGDLPRAHFEAEGAGEEAWRCYRVIADWHARRGEVTEYFALWPKLAAGTHRRGVWESKARLVQAVADERGWRAALDLTAHKRLGPSFKHLAFEAWADSGDVDGLLEAFAHDARGEFDEVDQLAMLVHAMTQSVVSPPEHDHHRVDELLERVLALDSTIDKQTMRARDGLLMNMWPAIGNPETLKRVRRAARTPMYKRELTVLPRDVR